MKQILVLLFCPLTLSGLNLMVVCVSPPSPLQGWPSAGLVC